MRRVETIGNATLILGDCLEVMHGFEDESVHMIWTDPPYGHSNHDGDFNARLNDHRDIESQPIANDDMASMRYVVNGMLTEAARVLKHDSCCCCCCGGPKPTFAWLAERMDRAGIAFFHSVIWDKKNPGLGWRYRRQHEMVMVAHRTGGKILWRDETIAARNIFELMPPRERMHPNEKPVALCEHFIHLHTKPGQVVLDPFMGSGTTGVAALNLGRKFIGIEVDPVHFQTAVSRIEAAVCEPTFFSVKMPVKIPVPIQLVLAL
jgi:site-specific DNA-methyltransferase (adenine-specific)